MPPIIQYASPTTGGRQARPPADCFFLGTLVRIISALVQYVCFMFIEQIKGLGHGYSSPEIGPGIILAGVAGGLVGFLYGGTLFIFEVIMHRRVRFRFALLWMIAAALIAGSLLGSMNCSTVKPASAMMRRSVPERTCLWSGTTALA